MSRAQERSTAIRAERVPTFSSPWGLLAITSTSGTGPKTFVSLRWCHGRNLVILSARCPWGAEHWSRALEVCCKKLSAEEEHRAPAAGCWVLRLTRPSRLGLRNRGHGRPCRQPTAGPQPPEGMAANKRVPAAAVFLRAGFCSAARPAWGSALAPRLRRGLACCSECALNWRRRPNWQLTR
jgi:hypothetical protein